MSSTIVSIDELESHLGDPRWVILDCRHSLQDFELGRRAYAEGHIPVAFFASVESDLSGEKTGSNGRHPFPEPERLAAFLRELGVRDDSQVVTYDNGPDMFASRAWLLLRYIGHDRAAVLDGGFNAWSTSEKPISTEVSTRAITGNVAARPHREMIVPLERVVESLEKPSFTLVDARGKERFAGEIEPIGPVAGHIPGARNYDFKQNFDERGFFKKALQLREGIESLGIAPAEMVHQCGSGVSSAVNMLAMEIAGLSGSRVYPGGWSEWTADRSRPVATGY